MEFSELKQKTVGEIKKMLDEKKEQIRKFRFDLAAGKVKNIKEIRAIKKDIARFLTVINKNNN